MSNVVKIEEVYLYTTNSEDSVKDVLVSNGIPFTHLNYNDGSQACIDALNSWSFGLAGEKRDVSFPCVHWKEFRDDWSTCVQIAIGPDEIAQMSLIANKSLIS